MNAPKARPAPLDLAQFEGHTPEISLPWLRIPGKFDGFAQDRSYIVWAANAAPTLLAECKRQREEIRAMLDIAELADKQHQRQRGQIAAQREALRRTTRWVGKAIADGAFRQCVKPQQAEKDLEFAEAALAQVKEEV